MSELEVGVISGVVGAIAGGLTGFIASRLNTLIDNSGKVTIKPYNHKLIYRCNTKDGFHDEYEAFEGADYIDLHFTIEIRNTAKLRKDYKNAKLILRTYEFNDEAFLLYNNDDDHGFQHEVMEPLDSKIIRLKSRIKLHELRHLQGKKAEFYVSITDSKDYITEELICTEENFLNKNNLVL